MFKKYFKAEGGFTLVELLVTIAILGVLFGIVTLTLSGVGDTAQIDICAAEAEVVQSAMDIYLAVKTTNTITAGSGTGADGQIEAGSAQFGAYLREDTYGAYTWDADGENLVQDSCPAAESE